MALYRWVAARLDIPPNMLRGEGCTVQAHGPKLADYAGVYTWLMG